MSSGRRQCHFHLVANIPRNHEPACWAGAGPSSCAEDLCFLLPSQCLMVGRQRICRAWVSSPFVMTAGLNINVTELGQPICAMKRNTRFLRYKLYTHQVNDNRRLDWIRCPKPRCSSCGDTNIGNGLSLVLEDSIHEDVNYKWALVQY